MRFADRAAGNADADIRGEFGEKWPMNRSNQRKKDANISSGATSGAWNIALRVWEIAYPILLYYVTVVIVMMLVQTFIGADNETYMLRQLIASLVAIPVVYTHYRYDRNLEGRSTLWELLTGEKVQWKPEQKLSQLQKSGQQKAGKQKEEKQKAGQQEQQKSGQQKAERRTLRQQKAEQRTLEQRSENEVVKVKESSQEVQHIDCVRLVKILLWVIAVSALLGISLNNIISMTPLVTVSMGYQEANEHFYGGSVIFEALASGITIPILEELLYRGVIYQRLKRDMPVMAAAVLSALLFGALHFNLVQFIYAFFIGLALVLLMERVGHMAAAVVGHMTASLIAVLRTETGVLAWSADGSAAAWVVSVVLLLVGIGILLFGLKRK